MSAVSPLTRRRVLPLVVACSVLALAPMAPSRAAEKKRVTVEDLITFTWTLSAEDPFSKANAVGAAPGEFRRGETFILTITGTPKAGYHTYPLTKKTETQSAGNSKLIYAPSDAFAPLWPVTETEPEFVDEGSKAEPDINLEHERPFTWTQAILVKPDAKPGAHRLQLRIELQVCERSCIFGTYPLDIPITVTADAPTAPDAGLVERSKLPPPAPEVVPVGPATKVITREKKADAPANGGATEKTEKPNDKPAGGLDLGSVKKKSKPSVFKAMGLFEFVFTGIGFGLLSLATPCVFPMIPITVSFFLKQSEQKRNSPKLLAGVYSGTIVTVLTIGGLVLSTFLARVSQHWATNLVLGVLFLVFALSLLGMFEIVLPTSLVNFTSAREGQGGLAGTFFMALTFTIISFACVAPFYGQFLILAASASTAGDWLKLLLGALAYSMTFASPFFVLALFPTLLRTLPRSGSWMNTVKVVMGFVEIAAAVKFLRSAELAYFRSSTFLTFDLSLGIYIALCVLCGLYLLNLYRLPHDHEPVERISVPRAVLAAVLLALGLYLTPALFKQPDGESQQPVGSVYDWIEAFLLPDENTKSTGPAVATAPGRDGAAVELVWSGELQKSLREADEEHKYVFVDFTAIICTNCRYNERAVFKRPEIADLLGKYKLVKLYTDNIPTWMGPADPAEQNRQLHTTVFETTQLPFYVVLKPSGNSFEVVGEYDEGKINRTEKFAEFLRKNVPAKPAATVAAK